MGTIKDRLASLESLQKNITPKPKRREDKKKEKRKGYLKQYQKTYRKDKVRKEICFNKEEYELICKSAEKNGQKTVIHFKECAFAYLRQSYVVPKISEIQELIFQIRAIGRNINQITFKLHKQGIKSFNEMALHKQLLGMEACIEESLKSPLLLKDYIRKSLENSQVTIHEIQKILTDYANGNS